MRLYHHYKNKPYRFIGEARHSETLDEVVIYETLYENRLGKVWVRPKAMFFESVQVDGRLVPRFERVPLALEETTEVTSDHIEVIAPIIAKAFGRWDADGFHSRLKTHKKFYLITAFVDRQAVGFKLGYKIDADVFYSWLGGVVPDFRRIGIASALMRAQHDWCRKAGYARIQTKTQNQFRDMFILNLKHGFEVTGCDAADRDGLKIVMEKRLV
jgi:GNAT superfamily N-acetyltransferase